MKKISWILASLTIHILLVVGVFYSDLKAPTTSHDEIVDLTLSAVENKKNSTRQKATVAPTKTDSPTESPDTKDNGSNPSLSSSSDETGSGNSEDLNQSVGWSEITRLPKVFKEVKAAYPLEAKKAGIDGSVILEIVIDRSGRVRDVKVISGPGYGMNESAIEALKQFEFQPAQKGNENVTVKIRYTYKFKLGVN